MQTPISCQVLQKHFCCDVARLLARHCSRLAVEPRSLPPSNIITIFAFLFLLQTKLYSPTLFLLFDNSQTAKWGIFKNICVKQQRKASQPIKQFMNKSDYVLKTQNGAFFRIFLGANGKSFRKITQKPGVWSDPLSVSGNHKLHFNTHSWRNCGVETSAGIGYFESQKHVVHFLFSIFSMGAKTPYSATKCAASLILTLFPLFSPSALIICSPYNRMGNIKTSLISKNQYLSPALTVSMLRSVSGLWVSSPFPILCLYESMTILIWRCYQNVNVCRLNFAA